VSSGAYAVWSGDERHLADLGYVLSYGYERDDRDGNAYLMNWRAYAVVGETETGRKFFNRAGYTSSPDPVDTIEEAQIFAEGSVKWDGCCNFEFTDVPLHTCSRADAGDLGRLLEAIYDLAAEEMPEAV
jgi:hypothetical protein